MLPVYTLSSSLSLGDLSPIRSLLSHTTNLLAGSGSPILTIDTTPVTSVPFSGAVTALCAVNGTKVAGELAERANERTNEWTDWELRRSCN